MSAVKDSVIKLIQGLADDCTIEDIQYHLYVREKVERGIRDIEAGRVVPHDGAKRRIAEWLKSIGPNQP